MKTISTIIISILFLGTLSALDLEQVLGENLGKYHSAKNYNDKLATAQTFERIALAESNEWMAQYYAAYGYMFLSYDTANTALQDKLLDEAQVFLDKALAIKNNESELHCLYALWYSSKMSIDPQTRGAKYVMLMNSSMEKSLALNAMNPRTYFLKGQFAYHAPEAFGGGKKKALSYYEKAEECFANENPSSPIFPSWGREINKQMLESVKQELNVVEK